MWLWHITYRTHTPFSRKRAQDTKHDLYERDRRLFIPPPFFKGTVVASGMFHTTGWNKCTPPSSKPRKKSPQLLLIPCSIPPGPTPFLPEVGDFLIAPLLPNERKEKKNVPPTGTSLTLIFFCSAEKNPSVTHQPPPPGSGSGVAQIHTPKNLFY